MRITAREIDVDPVRELPYGPAAYSSSHQKAEYTSAPATMRSTTSEIPLALKGPSIHIGNSVRFDIRFPTSPYFRDKVYLFSGTLSADGAEIKGGWTYRCDDCTCGGSTGTLTLTRIEKEA